jgi:site-specific DNA-methyltransferase (adenine-specific)
MSTRAAKIRNETDLRACVVCGGSFSTRDPRRSYCGSPCRQAAFRAREAKAKAVKRKRKTQEAAKQFERQLAEQAARQSLTNDPTACVIEVADVRTWRPDGVDVIIADPPYITGDALDLYAALADFALDVLPPHGLLATMTDTLSLPSVLDAMHRERLRYRTTLCWQYATPSGRDFRNKTFAAWKPIVIHHKDGLGSNARWLPGNVKSQPSPRTLHRWQQDLGGFTTLVSLVSDPGQRVCDPFLGSGTTAIAAINQARRFVGADISAPEIQAFQQRLLAKVRP